MTSSQQYFGIRKYRKHSLNLFVECYLESSEETILSRWAAVLFHPSVVFTSSNVITRLRCGRLLRWSRKCFCEANVCFVLLINTFIITKIRCVRNICWIREHGRSVFYYLFIYRCVWLWACFNGNIETFTDTIKWFQCWVTLFWLKLQRIRNTYSCKLYL